jgi:hypothetical protein
VFPLPPELLGEFPTPFCVPPPPEPPFKPLYSPLATAPPAPPPVEVIVVNPEPEIDESEPEEPLVTAGVVAYGKLPEDGGPLPPAPPSPTVTVITVPAEVIVCEDVL